MFIVQKQFNPMVSHVRSIEAYVGVVSRGAVSVNYTEYNSSLDPGQDV